LEIGAGPGRFTEMLAAIKEARWDMGTHLIAVAHPADAP
jgi:hypothetical protein